MVIMNDIQIVTFTSFAICKVKQDYSSDDSREDEFQKPRPFLS